jgi:trk system potassium uptake protein TrkH
MGQMGEFASFTPYSKDPLVSLVIPILIIIGGIGFFVWADILKSRDSGKLKLSLHSKIVLSVTAILILSGTLLTYLFEYNNNLTMSHLNIFEKIMASFFHSVTLRTAGFNTISVGDLRNATVAMSILFMFIGASPGSTGGGVKTTTFASIILATKAVILGEEDVNIVGRRLDRVIVSRSIAIIVMSIGIVILGIILISVFQPDFPLTHIVFEVVSAFGTVGLSMGITPYLGFLSKLVIIAIMFAGRVGILTVAFAIASKNQNYKTIYRYPNQKIMVG